MATKKKLSTHKLAGSSAKAKKAALYKMVEALINKDEETASAMLSEYMTIKSREIIMGEAEESEDEKDDEKDDEEKDEKDDADDDKDEKDGDDKDEKDEKKKIDEGVKFDPNALTSIEFDENLGEWVAEYNNKSIRLGQNKNEAAARAKLKKRFKSAL